MVSYTFGLMERYTTDRSVQQVAEVARQRRRRALDRVMAMYADAVRPDTDRSASAAVDASSSQAQLSPGLDHNTWCVPLALWAMTFAKRTTRTAMATAAVVAQLMK
jgi:hypothetical protein